MAKRKIDEQISYNWLFFLLAGCFAAVTAWAVYDETVTRREYKKYQESFFEIERDLNKKKVEAERAKLAENARYKELEEEKARIEAELRTPEKKAEIAKVQAELEDVSFAAFDATQNYTFSKSELDEAYYYYTLAKHDDPSHSGAKYKAAKATLDGLRKRTDEDEKKMLAAEEKKKVVQAKIDELTHAKRLADIKKEMESIRRPLDDAERALARSESKLSGLFGPATEIVQQDLPEIEKVDRCESCHMGAARGGFETVAQREFRSHPMRKTLIGAHPPEKFGCTTCHDGQGRATTRFYAHAPGPEEDAHAFHKHYWEFPLLKGPPCSADEYERGECDRKEYMESKCIGCHPMEWDLRSYLVCEADEECPTTPDGRPMICDIPNLPKSDDAPFPSVEEAEEHARLERLRAEGKAPRQEPPQKFCLTPEQTKKKYDYSNPDDRKRVVRNAELTLVDLAPNLSRGLRIIEEVGCYGCHPIAGYQHKPKPAPNLTRLAAKVSNPEWLIQWIEDPKGFRPNTRMPRFWPETLEPEAYPYRVDVEAITRKRREEATAMAAFLLEQSRGSQKYAFDLEPIPAGVQGDHERGKKLVGAIGCAACHNLPAETGAKIDHGRASHYDYGPDLANVGAKTTKEWIYAWVRNPKRYAPDTRMPDLRVTPQEAADIAEYLVKQTGETTYDPRAAGSLDDPRLVEKGRDLVRKYGCFGCHLIEGFEDTPGIGAELTEFGLKTTERLDFGDFITDHKQQTWDAWTYHKLKRPRVYAYDRSELRMPQFDLTNEEVRLIMVVLKGMRGFDAKEVQVLGRRLDAMEEQRERGREMMRLYNCTGCHTVDGRVGDIASQLFKGDEAANNGPPNLRETGAKTQPEWLFGFLKKPFPMRPLAYNAGIRMPTFHFTDEEATTLVAMFSAIDGAEFPFRWYSEIEPTPAEAKIGQAIYIQSGCVKQCHLTNDIREGDTVAADRKGPNLLLTKRRLRAEWVSAWLADPKAHLPYTAMTAFWASGANPMDQVLKDPSLASLLAGIEKSVIDLFRRSRERQIEAVRDFLWVLTPENAGSPAAPLGAATR